ncbi:MAG: glycosyltransferase family 4 protein [Lentisphaerae bacterium]|nr:glycosyltransferase family 4 protein [Lentisphaerota bacterium]
MRILFVARPGSVHSARWIGLLKGTGWDVAVFPASPERPHVSLDGVRLLDRGFGLIERSVRVRVEWPVQRRGMTKARDVARRFRPPWMFRQRRLAGAIRRYRPDIVHSLEMQHAGYLTLEAKEVFGCRFPYWIVQNWGSDISLFRHLRGHPEKLRAVLAACDGYDCECDRDVDLAREFGFAGMVGPVRPNTGGYDLAAAARLRTGGPTSQRRVIALKGYQGWAGRALVALTALERCADLLKGYRLGIYSALTEDIQIAGQLFEKRTGIPVEFLPNHCSHEQILKLHGSARISIGLSISDGISTSLLEAILMGSFPVQSGTGAASDWVSDGESAFLVPPDDPEPVAKALRTALADDVLVDRAASMNAATAAERLDRTRIASEVTGWYRECARAAAERLRGEG